jgi:hypothetical protein
MDGIRIGSLCGRPGISASEDLSRLEYDLIRVAFDPDRKLPFFLRFGLVLWITERYHLY